MARLWGLIIDLVLIVVGEFLACHDIPDRDYPDGVAELFGMTIDLTRMVHKVCRVFRRISINRIPLSQAKDIDVACS